MNIIKNIHLIRNLLNDKQLESLENSGLNFRRFARITFKILKVEVDTITIEVRQSKNPNGNYADKKRLIEIVNEVFKPYFLNYKLHKHPKVYTPAPAEFITADWIKKQMQKHKVGNKKLVQDLGIAKAEVSAMINGHVEIGIRTKGLFYYYFMNYNK